MLDRDFDYWMSLKEKYKELCSKEKSIPLFSQAWWLDAVCGEDHWDVALVEKGGRVVAALPYQMTIRKGMRFINMPKLTQTLGPWIRASDTTYAKQLSEHKKLMTALISNLPNYDYFTQKFHYSVTNWLPFYWNDYQQTTRYTYILEDLSNENELWNGLQSKIRTDIKKATNRFNLNVRTDLSLGEFLEVNAMTYSRQKKVVPYTNEFVRKLYETCMSKNSCRLFFAEDNEKRIHAVSFIVWDENSAYYLMGGGDPELRNSGATSLIMWEAIRFASTVTKRFDFEGSMIESVERYFRAFGGRQMPYFQITKTNSRLLKLRQLIRGIIR